jgi:hypothetical protein
MATTCSQLGILEAERGGPADAAIRWCIEPAGQQPGPELHAQ